MAVSGMLDLYGTDLAGRAQMCIILCCEDEPEDLDPEDRWPTPAVRAELLARWVDDEPEILDHAIELVRGLLERGLVFDDSGERPRRNFARALVVLTEARRIATAS